MEIRTEIKQGTHILVLSGELDLYNAPELKNISGTLLGANAERLIINLDKVDYIDSTGIGVLLNIHSVTKKKGIPFYLTNVHGTVEKVFRLTKLMGFLPIRDKVEEIV